MGTVDHEIPIDQKGPEVTGAPAADALTPHPPAESVNAKASHTTSGSLSALLTGPFSGPWRDGAPVFGCCRKSVAAAADGVEPLDLLGVDVTARVHALRQAVDAALPGHLSSHRCCVGHIADLAFDLPDLLSADVVEAAR